MKKSLYTEERIAHAFKQVELGMAVGEICRKVRIAEPGPRQAGDRWLDLLLQPTAP